MEGNRNVVLFARVSTDEGSQDLTTQLDALRALSERKGWDIVEEVTLERSAWDERSVKEVQQEALKPIKDGKADTLAVYCLDRISRAGVQQTFSFLRQLEEHFGAEFFSLQEPFLSTATADPHQRELMASIMSWMAEQESRKISERVRRKVESKRNRAAAVDGEAKWGRGTLAKPEQEDKVLELREDGCSFREIAERVDGVSKSQAHRIVKRRKD